MDRELKYALGKTVPIMFSYLFLSMAFGIMMNQAGFPFYWASLELIRDGLEKIGELS